MEDRVGHFLETFQREYVRLAMERVEAKVDQNVSSGRQESKGEKKKRGERQDKQQKTDEQKEQKKQDKQRKKAEKKAIKALQKKQMDSSPIVPRSLGAEEVADLRGLEVCIISFLCS